MTGGASPLRGRYLVRGLPAAAYLTVVDAALATLQRGRRRERPRKIRRLLISVAGQLGDGIIATSVLPAIRAALPNVEIGVLTTPWASSVFRGHPEARWTHALDHWKTTRNGRPLWERMRRWAQSSEEVVRDLRMIGYDAAVDLYPYYPSMSALFWRAGIPTRVGYVSGGGGPVLTHPIEWRPTSDHMSVQFARVVEALIGSIEMPASYSLGPIAGTATLAGAELLARNGIEERRYVVMHPGTGSALKEWPLANWIELGRALAATGRAVVITGAGTNEEFMAGAIQAAIPSAVNLVGQTPFDILRFVINRADMLVGVDSAATHIAAAEGTRCVAIMAGMSDARHWRPLSPSAAIITREVACAPCFRRDGCAEMTCVRGVTVADVLDLVLRPVAAVQIQSRIRA